MEYPEGCSSTIRCVVRKVGLYNLEMILPWEYNFQTGGLAYDILSRHMQAVSAAHLWNLG